MEKGFVNLQAPAERYRAVQLSVPNVVAQFQVTHRDADYRVTDSRVYNIDLNSGEVKQ